MISTSYGPAGKRNQAEFTWIIDPYLKGNPVREFLHNQLIMSVFTNSQRDPPDELGVASWVSANDKPTTATKQVIGDAAEIRLKEEIMQLPPRERHRLKQLTEVGQAWCILRRIYTDPD